MSQSSSSLAQTSLAKEIDEADDETIRRILTKVEMLKMTIDLKNADEKERLRRREVDLVNQRFLSSVATDWSVRERFRIYRLVEQKCKQIDEEVAKKVQAELDMKQHLLSMAPKEKRQSVKDLTIRLRQLQTDIKRDLDMDLAVKLQKTSIPKTELKNQVLSSKKNKREEVLRKGETIPEPKNHYRQELIAMKSKKMTSIRVISCSPSKCRIKTFEPSAYVKRQAIGASQSSSSSENMSEKEDVVRKHSKLSSDEGAEEKPDSLKSSLTSVNTVLERDDIHGEKYETEKSDNQDGVEVKEVDRLEIYDNLESLKEEGGDTNEEEDEDDDYSDSFEEDPVEEDAEEDCENIDETEAKSGAHSPPSYSDRLSTITEDSAEEQVSEEVSSKKLDNKNSPSASSKANDKNEDESFIICHGNKYESLSDRSLPLPESIPSHHVSDEQPTHVEDKISIDVNENKSIDPALEETDNPVEAKPSPHSRPLLSRDFDNSLDLSIEEGILLSDWSYSPPREVHRKAVQDATVQTSIDSRLSKTSSLSSSSSASSSKFSDGEIRLKSQEAKQNHFLTISEGEISEDCSLVSDGEVKLHYDSFQV